MHVLLVEDSDEVSCIIIEYLHELGHQVVAVAAAEQAAAQLREVKFDAVITDYSLPGMSGIQLARQLAKDYPNLPVVISSGGKALTPEFLLRNELGMVLVLPKPFDLPTLASTMDEAGAIARANLTAPDCAFVTQATSGQ
ncbi:MAG TPA: response regulator [Steroidobacteraceae bacterium]|jgi:CheY-like chemotaxis protein|nr:response regulator [Steroidobacteraceae bacterium]